MSDEAIWLTFTAIIFGTYGFMMCFLMWMAH
jgi:hypothetical protein